MRWIHDGALVLIALNLTFISVLMVLAPARAQQRSPTQPPQGQAMPTYGLVGEPGRGPQFSCKYWVDQMVCGLQVMIVNP